MAGLLTVSSIMQCPHGGMVNVVSSDTRVQAVSSFVLRSSDTFTVASCPFNPGTPHPCVRVQWVQPSLKSQAMGDFTLTEESVGLCVAADMAVQGTVLISFTQAQNSGL
jgi:hypothetical protein